MIQKIECYVPVCDICGKKVDEDAEIWPHFETEKEAADHAIECEEYGGGGAQLINEKLCCRECWFYDDDDETTARVIPNETTAV